MLYKKSILRHIHYKIRLSSDCSLNLALIHKNKKFFCSLLHFIFYWFVYFELVPDCKIYKTAASVTWLIGKATNPLLPQFCASKLLPSFKHRVVVVGCRSRSNFINCIYEFLTLVQMSRLSFTVASSDLGLLIFHCMRTFPIHFLLQSNHLQFVLTCLLS